MDPKPQMPEIKAEVNKVDDGKKKATGLAGLFGGGGSGAAGGLGGLGAGATGGGGLLATKAGMLALVLMGSAVAGGIGLAGYKMFGPSEADKGGNISLFAAKPAQPVDANGVAPVNADGSSASLDMMAQSAAKDKAADAAANASATAPTDNTAGDAAKTAAAADAASAAGAAGTGGAINAANGGGGAAGSMGHGLANVKKLGALSGAAGGGGSTSAGSGSTVRLGENIANAAKNGATSGFSSGAGAAKASSARGVASARNRNARAMLRSVGIDQQGGRAASSFAAGRTYDGSATHAGGAIGPDGSAIGMDGVGNGTGAQPKSIPQSARAKDKEQDPPVPDGKAVQTEWEKNIKNVMMLGALAIALVFAANSLKTSTLFSFGTTQLLIQAIGVAIIGIGIAIAVLAGKILNGVNGEPGQKQPGMLSAVAALAAIAAGIYVMTSMAPDGTQTGAPKPPTPAAPTAPPGGAPPAQTAPMKTPPSKLDLGWKPPTTWA